MIRGIYSSYTGMTAQYQRLDTLSNNIANADTDGYKSDSLWIKSFDEELASKYGETAAVGGFPAGVEVGGVSTDYTQGTMSQTSKSTDLAVFGNGFFAAAGSDGEIKYTRNGSFSLDTQGYLALPSGERLLGNNGAPVYVGSTDFQVSTDGTVFSGGNPINKITVYDSQSAQGISKRTDGFFNIADARVSDGLIRQGFVEGSNVNLVDQMTSMMEATRSFQSSQKSFQTDSETLDKLISQCTLR